MGALSRSWPISSARENSAWTMCSASSGICENLRRKKNKGAESHDGDASKPSLAILAVRPGGRRAYAAVPQQWRICPARTVAGGINQIPAALLLLGLSGPACFYPYRHGPRHADFDPRHTGSDALRRHAGLGALAGAALGADRH